MWNEKKSIFLSRLCVYGFFVLAVVGMGFGLHIIKWLVGFSSTGLQGFEFYLVASCYSSAVFVIITLFNLNTLLRNISKSEVFISENISAIRVCSWSCIAVSIICIASGLYYFLFYPIGVIAAFTGLILRIVKNVFERAIALKEENDYTI